MTRPLGAQISHMLAARGVDVVFGIPGVHNIELYRGIEEAGITHVLARHEQGAGFMADGYARATGKPGVAYVITGPGLTNILTPLGQAYSDSVSVLAISSCLDPGDLGIGRARLHEMKDQEAAAATVCEWSLTAMDAKSAYALVDRAFAEFKTQRPRPRHIQIPIEVLQAEADDPPVPSEITSLRGGQVPDWILSLITEARTPLFLFGGGARGDADLARKVMAQSGAAAFTTFAGAGILGRDAPLNFGSFLSRPDSARVIGQADVVVAVGTELSEVDLWRDHLGHTGPLVRVDIDTAELSDQPGAIQLHCDAKVFLEALSEKLGGGLGQSGWSADVVGATRARWRAEVDAARPGILPICDALRQVMPKDAMIYSDMTQFAYVAKEIWDLDRPGHWHHPYGFGTLGYALPASIGGAVGRPGAPTVCIVGDYGFHYTMAELGVAVELRLSLPILLWDNGKLKEIEDSMVDSQIAPNAVVAQNPDFVKLAEAFGARSSRPGTLEELQTDLVNAFEADGPTLIYMTPDLTAQ